MVEMSELSQETQDAYKDAFLWCMKYSLPLGWYEEHTELVKGIEKLGYKIRDVSHEESESESWTFTIDKVI